MSEQPKIKIQLIRSVKLGDTWKQPGRIVELEAGEANRLIRLKAATDNFNSETPVVDNSGKDDSDEEIELISSIEGVSDNVAEALIKAGFNTVEKVAEAAKEDLVAIKGIGSATAESIQASAEEMVTNPVAD